MTSKRLFWTSVIMAGTAAASWTSDAAGPDYLKVKDLTPVKALATPQHPRVVLVADGRGQAKLFVAVEKPSETLAILLKELVGTIQTSTGAELEIVKELPAPDVSTIVIGDCAASRAAGIDAGAIPVEGFVVKTAPNRVFLVGSTIKLPEVKDQPGPYSNEGIAWAVADFLERFVGSGNLITWQTCSWLSVAVIVGFTFGYFAFRAKTADLSGLFSAALIGIILLIFAAPQGTQWFLIMLTFLGILGSAATRYKFEYKKRIGVDQGRGGAQGYRNVFANGIVAAAAAVLFGVFQQPVFIVMYVGCVATAAADTLASEIGVTGGTPYMITTLKKVPIGTNGGVTPTGELVALLGSFAVSLVALLLNVITPEMMIICTIAGFVGTNIDSLVGALLENR